MSTPDPTAPVPSQQPDSGEPTARLPQHRADDAGAATPQDEAPDSFGLPEPPGRGEQHAYDASAQGESTIAPTEAGDGESRPAFTYDEPRADPLAPREGDAVEDTAPDAFGMPEPPDRGAQHEFDAPAAVPPAPGDASAPTVPPSYQAQSFPSGNQAPSGYPAASGDRPSAYQPPSGYPAAPSGAQAPPPPQPPTGQAPPSYIGGQPSPTPFPSAAGYPSPPSGVYPAGYPAGYPHGGYPPSGGNPTPTTAYPGPHGYAPVDPLAKSRTVAGILGIVLGGLGVHRFYLGYVGIGLVQIAVTLITFGIGWLWGFIEGILYLTQRTGTYSVDATGRPLRD